MKVGRVIYISAGRADILKSHNCWRSGLHNPDEVSITFSGQIESFICKIGAYGYLISDNPSPLVVQDDRITIEHRPKREGRGLGYYTAELNHALGLVRTARKFRADIALVDSGTMPFFMMGLFRLAGIAVVPILHNTLWPHGFRPTGKGQRAIQTLDAVFFRTVPHCIIAVSPEVGRQIEELAGPHHPTIHQIRAQFERDYFAAIPPPNPDAVPLEVMFVGRVVEAKGVLDIPFMARRIEDALPGRVHWTICGRGNALDELRALVEQFGLRNVVDVRGWTSLEDLLQVYAKAHVSIVPTRSGFAEGLAMTAAEAILAGRPIVSNPIVPALEILAPAAIAARSNDAASHADAVLSLARDRSVYRQLQAACAGLAAQFYDRDQGLAAVLQKALA